MLAPTQTQSAVSHRLWCGDGEKETPTIFFIV